MTKHYNCKVLKRIFLNPTVFQFLTLDVDWWGMFIKCQTTLGNLTSQMTKNYSCIEKNLSDSNNSITVWKQILTLGTDWWGSLAKLFRTTIVLDPKLSTQMKKIIFLLLEIFLFLSSINHIALPSLSFLPSL